MFKTTRIFLFAVCMGFSACDSNTIVSTTTDPNLSDPNNDVATNVGPVEKTVTADVLNKANEIRNSILDEIAGEDTETGTVFLLYSVDEEQGFETDIDVGEETACDEGGTRTIIGSVTLTLDDNQSTGTVLGSYTIQYQACQEIVLLTGSDGTCSAHATIDGEVSVTISTTYSLTQSRQTPELSESSDVGASTATALDIAVGATASTQTYSFTYDLSTSSSSTNLDGTVSYNNLLYNLLEVETFVEGVGTAVLCP